jgi:transposase-like protein
MPGGRPREYSWERIQPLMAEAIDRGMYIEQLATHLGIHDETVREWEKIYPEFSAAVKDVRLACKHRIASLLDDHATGNIEKGNGSVAIFIAKNVLGWRDRQEVEQTVKGESSITVTIGGARQDEDDAETH